MPITAIETTYRGYRFRSRLEARWAVFFDYLGMTWKYEVQGYLVGADKRPYLPDFWVQDIFCWVEVKGDPEALDLLLADDAVNASTGLPRTDPWGYKNLLILGDIPDPGEQGAWLHSLVSRRASTCDRFCLCSDAQRSKVVFHHISERAADMAAATGEDFPPREEWPHAALEQVGRPEPHWLRPRSGSDLVTPRSCIYMRPDPVVTAAYRAARSARFEHGETPDAP